MFRTYVNRAKVAALFPILLSLQANFHGYIPYQVYVSPYNKHFQDTQKKYFIAIKQVKPASTMSEDNRVAEFVARNK